MAILLNVFGRGCSTGTLCLCYVYSAEIYPTVIRNVGIGSSSLWVINYTYAIFKIKYVLYMPIGSHWAYDSSLHRRIDLYR